MIENLRNKLQSRGVESLEDKELITLLLEGRDDDEVAKVVDALFAECPKLGDMRRIALSRMRMVGGMGRSRAERILAALELGRRVAMEDASSQDIIRNNEDIVRLMRPQLQQLPHEECWAIYLAASNRVLEKMRVSQGGVYSTVVDTRMVMKRGLELLASKIVLVHNHPSGKPQPSVQDIELTERIERAAKFFEMELLDHIVIANEGSYSFRAQGLIASEMVKDVWK